MDLLALEKELTNTTHTPVLVSLMHGNNEIGTMIDLDVVAGLCKEHGAYFHTDTVQTVGRFPIDVGHTPIHFLAGSAHKIHGPKGVGFVYINPDIRIHPSIDGGGQERNMRSGTENISGIVTYAMALKMAVEEMDQRRSHIEALRSSLREGLLRIVPGIQFNGDLDGAALYTVLSASFPPSPKNELLVLNLDISEIAASGGSACSSGAEKGSHVLEATSGADPDRKSVRFSFSHLNTEEEVNEVLARIEGMF